MSLSQSFTSTGLETSTLVLLEEVFRKYSAIERVILYGSRAKGTQRLGSDIDLCLVGPSIDLSLLSRIQNDLDELNLPYLIDCSIYHRISNPRLLDHIERVGINIFQKGPQQRAF